MPNQLAESALLAAKIWRFVRWPLAVLFILFVGVVIYRIPAVTEKQKTEEQVAKIHTTKLALDDVLGVSLPPAPDPALADASVAGVDANKNGIRDDVELAIFAEYPDSAKTRAVLLQYALALQMEATQEIVNEGIVIAAVQEESRAYLCVGEILSRDNMQKFIEESDRLRSFVEEKHLNTEERRKVRQEFYEKVGSHESLERICDIDYSTLPN